MAKNASFTQINPNQYNSLTGQVAGSVKRLAGRAKKTNHNLTIDGFVQKPGQKNLSRVDGKTGSMAKSKQAAQAVHRGALRSRTLMRSIVRKPDIITAGKTVYRPKAKPSADSLNPARLSRSQRIIQSPKVRHFGILAPAKTARTANQPASVKTKTSPGSKDMTMAVATIKPLPSMVTSVSHQHLERLLDHALFRAGAHKNSLQGHKNSNRRKFLAFMPGWLVISATLVIVLVIAGLFAWQNVPQVAVKVAAVQADLKATVPTYSPSGFSFEGPMSTGNNSVSMKFQSNANASREFIITQQASDWDSDSLLANFVTPMGKVFQTSQVKGSTVYIYGEENHATWVNNGIWYKIDDQASLNSDQLLKIAESM